MSDYFSRARAAASSTSQRLESAWGRIPSLKKSGLSTSESSHSVKDASAPISAQPPRDPSHRVGTDEPLRQQNVVIHVPPSYVGPSPQTQSFAEVTPIQSSPISSLTYGIANTRHRISSAVSTTVTSAANGIVSDPMIASLFVLGLSTRRGVSNLCLNGRMVLEDPLPFLRWALRRTILWLRAKFLDASRSPRCWTYVLCLAIVFQLARFGVFRLQRNCKVSSSPPLHHSPKKIKSSPPETDNVSVPRPTRLISGISITPSVELVREKENKQHNGDVLTTPRQANPLSDGTLSTVASRFLALITNSPAPAGEAHAEATHRENAEEVVVVNNGAYIETYELKLSSGSSPVLDDPDRFAASLIENRVREEKRGRSPSLSKPSGESEFP